MIDWQNPSTWQVMVVDDEPDNLEVVAETLEYQGVHVRTAQNGKEAIELLEDFAANLILTDLSMPVMNGWEMRARVKNHPNMGLIPIVALSAHAFTGDRSRALDVGFDGYLTKPINIATLLEDIRSAVIKPAVASRGTVS
jgi:CheY-like chemotaxis protein